MSLGTVAELKRPVSSSLRIVLVCASVPLREPARYLIWYLLRGIRACWETAYRGEKFDAIRQENTGSISSGDGWQETSQEGFTRDSKIFFHMPVLRILPNLRVQFSRCVGGRAAILAYRFSR